MRTAEYATLNANRTNTNAELEEKAAEEMSVQKLVDHMLHSKSWRIKEDLFFEVFPQAEDRCRFFVEYTRYLVATYRRAGKPIDGLHDLLIRKLAIDDWFKTRNLHS